MTGFWGGLQEVVLAGVDGWSSVEQARIAAETSVEQTPPVPDPDRAPTVQATGLHTPVAGVPLWVLLVGGLGVTLLLVRK